MSDSPRVLLEARLAANPASPALIRLAFMNLEEGRLEEALRLGLEGRKRFPGYASVYLLLGRCLSAMGRMLEALLEYRKALQVLPDNFALRAMVSEIEVRRLSEYRLFSDSNRTNGDAAAAAWSLEEFLSGERRSKPAAQEQPPPPALEQQRADGESAGDGSSRIVTPTLAEIYASQGEYREAISAYRRLIERRPRDAERFSMRVAELEALARRQEEEGKTGGNPA